MRDEVALKGRSHVVRMERYTRGSHPVTGHSMFGWHLKCHNCGWFQRCNMTKREARSYAMDHVKRSQGGGI